MAIIPLDSSGRRVARAFYHAGVELLVRDSVNEIIPAGSGRGSVLSPVALFVRGDTLKVLDAERRVVVSDYVPLHRVSESPLPAAIAGELTFDDRGRVLAVDSDSGVATLTTWNGRDLRRTTSDIGWAHQRGFNRIAFAPPTHLFLYRDADACFMLWDISDGSAIPIGCWSGSGLDNPSQGSAHTSATRQRRRTKSVSIRPVRFLGSDFPNALLIVSDWPQAQPLIRELDATRLTLRPVRFILPNGAALSQPVHLVGSGRGMFMILGQRRLYVEQNHGPDCQRVSEAPLADTAKD